MHQAPAAIFMVRPDHFGYNPETATSNAFQHQVDSGKEDEVRQMALSEFANAVSNLKAAGIEVHTFPSPVSANAPDAVFPNNWISCHHDGTIVLYPMLTPNRRVEVQPGIIEDLKSNFHVKRVIDLTGHTAEGHFLEGTGSIVFDHVHNTAYANRSDRTDEKLFFELCGQLDYKGICFDARDESGLDIYHTNVLMTIGDGYAVVCFECISPADRDRVRRQMEQDNLEIVEISIQQMRNFAGNMIEVQNRLGVKYLVVSQSAYDSLGISQKSILEKYVKLLPIRIPTIETIGGGSVRCMIAGIHLPGK